MVTDPAKSRPTPARHATVATKSFGRDCGRIGNDRHSNRPFRFGVSLFNVGSRQEWQDRARAVEDAGFDVLHVVDHLGCPAPFPALVAAAAATTRLQVGTYVLNTGVHSPEYLARDVADVHRLTDGRLELGLGAGYIEAEFEAAGVPFGTGGERVRRLERTLAGTLALLAGEPDKPVPPIMIGGAGDRVLRLAGREADIVSFPPETAGSAEVLAERVRLVREAAGDRDVEFNLLLVAVGRNRDELAFGRIRGATGVADDEKAVHLPCVLVGSPREMADRLRDLRERFGISYFSVFEPDMAAFAEVIPLLR
jgi:probable F420-dependent oxidoreductase